MSDSPKLLPCPLCDNDVHFHEHPVDCPSGCHNIECSNCGLFDLSQKADPNNTAETLYGLRAMIAQLWNRRVISRRTGFQCKCHVSKSACCSHPRRARRGDELS